MLLGFAIPMLAWVGFRVGVLFASELVLPSAFQE